MTWVLRFASAAWGKCSSGGRKGEREGEQDLSTRMDSRKKPTAWPRSSTRPTPTHPSQQKGGGDLFQFFLPPSEGVFVPGVCGHSTHPEPNVRIHVFDPHHGMPRAKRSRGPSEHRVGLFARVVGMLLPVFEGDAASGTVDVLPELKARKGVLYF